jgi:molybdopterin adenylyltransferase
VSVAEHKRHAPPPAKVRVAAVTVSDTRTEATDEGGRLVRDLCGSAGFEVVSRIILRDEPTEVAAHVRKLALGPSDSGAVDAVLLTGGTGLSRRDSTVEALAASFDKTIDGFGELFRMLSFQELGAAAMLSRATAGTIGRTAVFLMPGSPAAVRLALERLILPELAHITSELNRGPEPHAHGAHQHG